MQETKKPADYDFRKPTTVKATRREKELVRKKFYTIQEFWEYSVKQLRPKRSKKVKQNESTNEL